MKKYLPVIILLACTAAFAIGIVQLFELRFEEGDVYPEYSSLRADPLGAMAFYESLEKMPGIAVRRDFSTSNRLPEEPATAYLHLAAESGEWDWLPDDLFREIKSFVARGGRLVITYRPQTRAAFSFDPIAKGTNSFNLPPSKLKGTNEPPNKSSTKKKKVGVEKSWISLEDEWRFHEGFEKLDSEEDVYTPAQVENKSDLALPRSLNWHSGMIFTNCDPAWRKIYVRGTNAVVIERDFGSGSVVLASDSFFVSNEAMLKDRHADLLAWLVGPNSRIVFDEAHLGIVESPGVAALMRKYRLHGLAVALLILAGLFIWKNATSLVPPHADEQREDFVGGKDVASGFVNLLRRSIPAREIFGVCFAEWKKSVAPSGTVSRARLREAEIVFQAEISQPSKDQNPIATYKLISETLGRRKPKV